MKRYVIGALLLLLGFALVLGIEIALAVRVERIDPYPPERLDGLIAPGPREPIRLVWIGDSTGDGVGASSPDHALPRVVATGLARPIHLSVLARSGSRAADAVAEQLPRLAALRPQWVIIAIGGNDVTHLTRRARFRTDLDALVAGATAAGAERVVVLGVGEFAATPLLRQPLRALAGARAHRVDADVRAVARRHGALYVDIIGETGRAFAADPRRLHARDGFHPSDDGYALWADATLRAIRRAGW